MAELTTPRWAPRNRAALSTYASRTTRFTAWTAAEFLARRIRGFARDGIRVLGCGFGETTCMTSAAMGSWWLRQTAPSADGTVVGVPIKGRIETTEPSGPGTTATR